MKPIISTTTPNHPSVSRLCCRLMSCRGGHRPVPSMQQLTTSWHLGFYYEGINPNSCIRTTMTVRHHHHHHHPVIIISTISEQTWTQLDPHGILNNKPFLWHNLCMTGHLPAAPPDCAACCTLAETRHQQILVEGTSTLCPNYQTSRHENLYCGTSPCMTCSVTGTNVRGASYRHWENKIEEKHY